MKSFTHVVLCVAALFVAASAFAGSSQGWLYWAEGFSDTIKRSHLDGTNVEIVYSTFDGVVGPGGLGLIPKDNQAYWTSIAGSIQRGSLDGLAPVEPAYAVPGMSPNRMVVNPDAGTMYWLISISSNTKIFKADIDGSDFEEITLEDSAPTALAIDPEGGKLYWGLTVDVACVTAKIQRSDLDGTNIEDMVTGLKYITALAVDHDLGKIYWSEQCGVNAIKQANLDGTGVETLVAGEYAHGIAIDSAGGKMYWTRATGDPYVIRWANLDGTQAADLISVGLQFPIGIAVLPQSGSPADLNDDGLVNGIDLAILLGAWGRCPPKGGCDADLAPSGGGDGIVNGFDLALLLGAWST